MDNISPASYSSSPTAPDVIRGDDSLHKGLEDGFQVSLEPCLILWIFKLFKSSLLIFIPE
jgi:hypothetical protein